MPREHHAQVHNQLKELDSKYPGFVFEVAATEGETLGNVIGTLCFHATNDNTSIYDEYQIKVVLDSSYPQKPPRVFETGDRIPPTHHQFADGSLCLAAPLRVRMDFAANPSLLGFIEALVIPYLFSYSFFQRHNRMPFGELSHHGKGIIEFYSEFLGISSPSRILKMLAAVYQRSSWRHLSCPCGSGKYLRLCHWGVYKAISKHSSREEIRYDVVRMLHSWKSMGLHPSGIPKVFENIGKEAKRRPEATSVQRD